MIKKVILIFFILFGFIFILSSENLIDLSSDMFFYIPEEGHIADYINFYDYLKQWEDYKVTVNDEKLLKFYKDFVGQKTFHGLLFEAFLRQTKNKNIRRQVLLMIKGNKLDDVFSKILARLYDSRENKIKMQDAEQLQYSYNNQYFDENINLFNQNETLFFDNELGLMLFDNPLRKTDYKRIDEKDVDKDAFFLNYKGETNSIGIYLYKFSNIKFEEFKNKEIYNKNNFERFKDWTGNVRELEISGILKKSNADKIFINYGTGENIFPDEKFGLFTIYLYNEKLERGYSVSYNMSFSKKNNNFEMRSRLWNHLLMQLMFCYINLKKD